MTSQHLVPVMNLYIQTCEPLTFSSKCRLLGENKKEGGGGGMWGASGVCGLYRKMSMYMTLENKAYSG